MSSQIEQIKSRLSIVDVVQSYIKLQKSGINLKAPCPFHSEKTPSFFVSPSRESWHCFGCNRGGDIFSFVMEIEGVEFVEALKVLADRAGITLKPLSKESIVWQSEKTKLLKLLEDSRKFYESELKKNEKVIFYLKERGLKGETAKEFGIGFSSGWNNLHDFLKSRGYREEEMEKAGMIIKSQSAQGGYDRFRDRIMFPLTNSSGQTVGFSGRIFGADDGAKYINSPQTILYDKSKILYGFDKAKTEIRKNDSCILVEGQMDVVMSHQAGIKNVVAVSGTALTDNHLIAIKRLTDNIIISFDRDKAGFEASKRGIDMAIRNGFDVKIAVVSSGKDPADAVKENPEIWAESIKQAKHVIQFYLDYFGEKNKDDERNFKKDVEKIIFPFIALIPSEIDKAHWIGVVSQKIGVKEEIIEGEIRKIGALQLKNSNEKELINISPLTSSRLEIIRDRLIGFLLWQKNSSDEELKKIMEKIINDYGVVLNQEENDIRRLVFEVELLYNNSDKLNEELVKIALEFEKEKIKTELEEITVALKKAEIDGNEAVIDDYMSKFHNLLKKYEEKKQNS